MPLIKLHKHSGVVDPAGAIRYNLADRDHAGVLRSVKPVVLSGDPALVQMAIDSSAHERKYTSGTVSFSLEEAPTAEQQQQIMKDCERLWFAGIDDAENRVPVLWVRHEDKGGRVELNFVIPRIDLMTTKSFNACPPKITEASHDRLVDYWHSRYENMINPRDPAHAQLTKQVPRFDPQNIKDLKLQMQEHLELMAVTGQVRSREDVLEEITNLGYSIKNAGKTTITIVADDGTEARLRGALFRQEWKYSPEPAQPMPRPDRATAAAELERVIESRSEYNAGRYTPKPEPRKDIPPPPWLADQLRRVAEAFQRVMEAIKKKLQRKPEPEPEINFDYRPAQLEAGPLPQPYTREQIGDDVWTRVQQIDRDIMTGQRAITIVEPPARYQGFVVCEDEAGVLVHIGRGQCVRQAIDRAAEKGPQLGDYIQIGGGSGGQLKQQNTARLR